MVALNCFLGILLLVTVLGCFFLKESMDLSFLSEHICSIVTLVRLRLIRILTLVIRVFLFWILHMYRSLVGSLQYLTLNRPGLSYAMQQIWLYMHNPENLTWQLLNALCVMFNVLWSLNYIFMHLLLLL